MEALVPHLPNLLLFVRLLDVHDHLIQLGLSIGRKSCPRHICTVDQGI